MRSLSVLERFVRGRAVSPEAPACELCAVPVGDGHRHVVDLEDRRLLCACGACAVLSARSSDGRFRTVPGEVRAPRGWSIRAEDFDALGITVGLAFLVRSSKLGRWTVVLPSPAGPTEAELSDAARATFEQGLGPHGRAFVATVEAEVEALLVRRRRDGSSGAYIVPIDVAYELAGLIRQRWSGISGGDEVDGALDAFFARLAERAEPKATIARFERARAIADAILLEGYVLYPYRPDTTKNRHRWTFGVLAPRAWSEGGGSEPWWLKAAVLVESNAPRLRGRLRFLRVVERRLEVPVDGGGFRAVDELEVNGRLRLPSEEGELTEIDVPIVHERGAGDVLVPFSLASAQDIEPLEDGKGALVGRVVRTRSAVHGAIRVHLEVLGSASRPLSRVDVRVENVTPCAVELARRDVVRSSCVATHILLASESGPFVSLFDPPERAARAAAESESVGTYPVLAGEPGSFDLMLASPIILEDHPRIAPESPGDPFDSGEIDELFTRRTKTLTPEERALARAADPRVDRVDAMSDEAMARLHGIIRERRTVGRFARGQRVRLRPRAGSGARRADARDLLLGGHTATIEAVIRDIDGNELLAVTVDGDPAAELNRWYGRYHHFAAEEVEPL